MALDGLNRVLAVAFATVVAAGGLVGVLVSGGVISPTAIAPLGDVGRLSGVSAIAATGGFGVLSIAGLVLMWVELAPVLRRPYMRGGAGTDREFAVRETAVEQMVRYAGEQVEYVIAVEDAHVSKDEHGLEVAAKVVLEPYAAAGPLAPLLEGRIRNAVYTMTGLSVGRVRLRIRHAEEEEQLVSARR